MDKITDILTFWFGPGQGADLPTEENTKRWFGGGLGIDEEIKQCFEADLIAAINHDYQHWQETPRGSLALIILLDQFSRHVYRNTPKAFSQDDMALKICVKSINQGFDQKLSLIERVFFYLPLEHAEDLEIQMTSVGAYKALVDYCMPETKPIFQNFFNYALDHYKVIERYRRFPHRNKILGRESTAEELNYLKELMN